MMTPRRKFLVATGGAAVASVAAKKWSEFDERGRRASVAVVKAPAYDDTLADTIERGLVALGLPANWGRGKSVLLKPNLVEPSKEAPHINTHPAVIRAAAEVFRRRGAREVFVAEGQGHCRDSDLVLEQSRRRADAS